MKKYRRHARAFAAAVLIALVAACGSVSHDVRPLPSSTQAERVPAEVGRTEEIVIITGNRVGRGGGRGRSAFAPSIASPTPLSDGAALEHGQSVGGADEIWFIAVPGDTDAGSGAEDRPGSGALVATVPGSAARAEPTTIPLPLEHTDVRAAIRGYVGIVDVRQEFRNPYTEKIEAVYLFPLPENAATVVSPAGAGRPETSSETTVPTPLR